jgi:hypothetical protein
MNLLKFLSKPAKKAVKDIPKPTKPKPEVQNLFNEELYHYTRSKSIDDDIMNPDYGFHGNAIDRLGIHAGTQQAAIDRGFSHYGAMINGEPQLETGTTLPLLARTDKPFTKPNGEPWTEFELRDFVNQYGEDNKIEDRAEIAKALRRDLAAAGYTNVPYINAVEDAGSVSQIMLVDRPVNDLAVLRSRFAKFQDAYGPQLGLSVAGGLMSPQIMDYLAKVEREERDGL